MRRGKYRVHSIHYVRVSMGKIAATCRSLKRRRSLLVSGERFRSGLFWYMYVDGIGIVLCKTYVWEGYIHNFGSVGIQYTP